MLTNSEFRDANLDNAHLNGANLNNAHLCFVNLSNAELQNAKLNEANLSHSNLAGAILNSATLHNANLVGVQLNKVKLNNANLSGANLSRANLCEATLIATKLYGANLYSANLSKANITGVNLATSNLQNANLYSVYSTNINLTYANLKNANLENANLDGSDLQYSNFYCANLFGVNLQTVKALETNFSGATLTGACIENWNINSKTNFDNVICDYIYLKQNKQERRPSDPNRNFEPGEFAALVQKSVETVDLIFNNGIDWQSFLKSFQDIQVEGANGKLAIQAIERKTRGAFLVRVEVPPNADKASIEASFWARYNPLLEAKDKEIKLLSQQTEFYSSNSQSANFHHDWYERIWQLQQTSPNNGWGNWEVIGDVKKQNLYLFIEPLVASQYADDRIVLFTFQEKKNFKEEILYAEQSPITNKWSKWIPFAAPLPFSLSHAAPSSILSLAVEANIDGRLELFTLSKDGEVWHIWQKSPNDNWSAWQSLNKPSGTFPENVIVSRNDEGQLQIFIRDAKTGIWCRKGPAP